MVVAYAEKGHISEARRLFQTVPRQESLSWSFVVVAYSFIGAGREALEEFYRVDLEGIKLDSVMFCRILHACSHTGLVDEALYFFSVMVERGVAVEQEHYNCIVDILGRAGRLEEAEEVLNSLPSLAPHLAGWQSLLSSCKIQADARRGARAALRVIQSSPGCSSGYSLLANVLKFSSS
ncbi:hypothetical protein SELMODRAFT_133790 [Selaginella moellendorffii]|uniref:Pentacotripeptide-repeat region of PRORP domain-containing protein n=2 Tax=Selaginella moellendorffii TaxID=88036 RepID=D8T7L2_SELML|nr:hypothetical protein SELMODRAFT_133790 [Selaginella moellendorffii]